MLPTFPVEIAIWERPLESKLIVWFTFIVEFADRRRGVALARKQEYHHKKRKYKIINFRHNNRYFKGKDAKIAPKSTGSDAKFYRLADGLINLPPQFFG